MSDKEKEIPGCDWPSDGDAGGHQDESSALATQSSESNIENRNPETLTLTPKVRTNITEHCMVCGAPLAYHERAEESRCIYCDTLDHGHISCPNGHYVCDMCHNRDAMGIIEDIAFTTESMSPFAISELMMSYPGLPMLGCQHAHIAGGALMAAIKNEGSKGITDEQIKEVFDRTRKQAHGGYCGLTGVCGIAPAIGACFAVLTGSKCGKDEEQRITMEAVTRVSRAIADLTGPSCCKAYVRTSLEAAVDYLKESLGIELPLAETALCNHSLKHPHGCRETKCPYFNSKTTAFTKELAADSEEGNSLLNVKEGKDSENKMEHLLKRALELGAEKAKVIETNTIVVEEWVRWKCHYGCLFCGKDAYHPPYAPDAESTKKVVKEYSKAILMNSSKGKSLTEAAVRLEGEAYHEGYYKAFALTALSSGPEGGGWPSGEAETPGGSQTEDQKKLRIRPLMEACGIDVFKTAKANGFEIDTKHATYGRWNYFALVLVE